MYLTCCTTFELLYNLTNVVCLVYTDISSLLFFLYKIFIFTCDPLIIDKQFFFPIFIDLNQISSRIQTPSFDATNFTPLMNQITSMIKVSNDDRPNKPLFLTNPDI